MLESHHRKLFPICPADIACNLFHTRTYGGHPSFVVRVWLIWVNESSFLQTQPNPLQTGGVGSSSVLLLLTNTIDHFRLLFTTYIQYNILDENLKFKKI